MAKLDDKINEAIQEILDEFSSIAKAARVDLRNAPEKTAQIGMITINLLARQMNKLDGQIKNAMIGSGVIISGEKFSELITKLTNGTLDKNISADEFLKQLVDEDKSDSEGS